MDSFYRAFEDRFRGTREEIMIRLEAYAPFLTPLKALQPKPRALDIGCGRGEWLQVLAKFEFDALGVDLDEGMLKACEELGLNAKKMDALDWLRDQKPESVSLVSGFHIAEHLPFAVLQEILQSSLRVLMPGGLLILETPNPENLIVATKTFHLDPTHNKPIPPEFLSFLAEQAGFARVRVVRLQENTKVLQKRSLSVLDVLSAVSADYSIVAQKSAEEPIIAGFDSAFSRPYGLSIESLAQEYDEQIERKLHRVENELRTIQSNFIWRILTKFHKSLRTLVPPLIVERYRKKIR